MRKKLRGSSAFLLGLSLFFYGTGNLLASADTFVMQGQSDTEIEMKGYIGTAYQLNAHNIVVHVKDVKGMNIWKASGASVSITGPTDSTLDKVTPWVSAPTLKAEIGAYKVTLGIQEDATVHREITVFVVDDVTVTDKETLLFGQDFELTPGEKRNLTAEKVKAVAKVRAYDIQSGAEITKEVKTNTQDLMHYLQEDEKAVTQRFSVRGVTLEVQASTLLPSEQSTHGTTGGEDGTFVSGGKLPSTGESNNLLAMMGIAFLTLLSLLLVHHKGLIKRKNEGGV